MGNRATNAPTQDQAEDALRRICIRHGIPGAVFGVMQGGEMLFTATFGVTSLHSELPVRPDSLFLTGSIGKTYTATLVMQLVDAGKLDLDMPVRRYLPEFELGDVVATAKITTRQLLTHTSGIDGDNFEDYGRGEDATKKFVASLRDMQQIVEPGRIWTYSNAGYGVLARLVEVLTGLSFEEAVRQKLLQKLGLKTIAVFPEEAIAYHPFVGHVRDADGQLAISPKWALPRSLNGAGGTIITNIADLLGYAQMHLDLGRARDGTRIISEESAREMQRLQFRRPHRDPFGDHWGLGWSLTTEGGPKVIQHDGNSIGQSTFLRMLPEQGISYALAVNIHGALGVFPELCRELLDPWTGIHTPETGPEPDPDRQIDFNKVEGTFAHFALRAVIERASDGSLTISLTPLSSLYQGMISPEPRAMASTVEDDVFLIDLKEFGEGKIGVVFLEPDPATGKAAYLSFAGRLFRREA